VFAATGSARRLVAVPLLLAVLLVGLLPAATVTANNTITELQVAPLYYRTATSGAADIRLNLRRAARVTVTVHRPNGRIVRTLAKNVRLARGLRTWKWNGRNQAGNELRDGVYRVRVTAVNGRGKVSEAQRFRKGLPPIFPARPRAIVVVIDPGHGGQYWGAHRQGNREKHYNLDIAFRLRTLLRQAGVRVVMTRTTDTEVNSPARDVNGDGKINRADDLAARIDVANRARADLFISIHNNASSCRCVRGTEVFANRFRSWTPETLDFASLLHREQMRALSAFRSRQYRPINRGVKSGKFFIMAPHSPPRNPRPSLMPTLLTESLYVDNSIEVALLQRAAVRQALATSFYVGIANYLNTRDYGIRYRLLREPSGAVARGSKVRYVVRVTNRGNRRSSGWVLQLRAVRQAPFHNGSERLGKVIGSKRIPNGLRPGQSVNIVINGTAPKRAGSWFVKAGVRVNASNRPHLSQRGVVDLHTTLRTRR
jgi:N-acetylmuramoyl-L-alanine amidase